MASAQTNNERRRRDRLNVSMLTTKSRSLRIEIVVAQRKGREKLRGAANGRWRGQTHRETTKYRGLIHTADDVDEIVQEMLMFECGTPKQCELFALVLVWHDVGDTQR